MSKRRGELYLLSETDPRAGIERQEDERVWSEIFLQAFVEKTIRVELQGYDSRSSSEDVMTGSYSSLPSGPHRSFLLCIIKTE